MLTRQQQSTTSTHADTDTDRGVVRGSESLLLPAFRNPATRSTMVMDNSDSGQQPTSNSAKVYPINAANARELALRSHEARRKRKAAEALCEPITDQSQQQAQALLDDQIARARELRRLRKQLDNFDGLIERETDAKALQMLTNARWKQFETWRILSGMPLPGSFKPMQPRDKRTKISDLPQPE